MYTVYKDGTELTVDRDQLALLTNEGWSTEKEAKSEEGSEGDAGNKEPKSEGSEGSEGTGAGGRRKVK